MRADSGRRAVFLDRDGVINENRPDYVKAWGEFAFLPGSLTALALLARSPLAIVVVTNQSAVARGTLRPAVLEDIHRRLLAEVAAAGGRIDGVYVCPHAPGEQCGCRKPESGLYLQAAEALGLDLRQSICIGDKLSDLAAGAAVGCRGILVLTGEGRRQTLPSEPAFGVANDLGEAVGLILVELAAPIRAEAEGDTWRWPS